MGMHMVDSREKKPWSSLATNFCVAVITFATGIAANFAWTLVRTSPTAQQPPLAATYGSAEIGTLKRRILEAKAKGENTVELSVLVCGWDIGNLDEALGRDTVVLAELVDKKTYPDVYGLRTWYRFKTRETLVEHPYPNFAYSPFPSGPSDMLPIAEDEFLIQETNGQMVIDGVTVTQSSNGAKYFKGQTYLLFLWIEPSKRTAIRAGTDPLGVFLVDSDGNLSSYIDRPYPLRTALAKRFNNSIKNLRQALKKRPSTRDLRHQQSPPGPA